MVEPQLRMGWMHFHIDEYWCTSVPFLEVMNIDREANISLDNRRLYSAIKYSLYFSGQQTPVVCDKKQSESIDEEMYSVQSSSIPSFFDNAGSRFGDSDLI